MKVVQLRGITAFDKKFETPHKQEPCQNKKVNILSRVVNKIDNFHEAMPNTVGNVHDTTEMEQQGNCEIKDRHFLF